MIPALVAIGVVVAGLAITTTYVVLVAQKKDKNSDDLDFRCPECGASVDGNVIACPKCSAQFKEGEFECPVCGSAVAAELKMCLVCNEIFEDEEAFLCPNCSSPVQPDTIVCEKCDEEFWSPLIPPSVAEVEELTSIDEGQEDTSEATSS